MVAGSSFPLGDIPTGGLPKIEAETKKQAEAESKAFVAVGLALDAFAKQAEAERGVERELSYILATEKPADPTRFTLASLDDFLDATLRILEQKKKTDDPKK